MTETAQSAIETRHRITEIRLEDMEKVHKLGKSAADSTLTMLQKLYSLPAVGLPEVTE